MGAEEYDFIADQRIGAGDFGDYVVPVRVGRIGARLHVDAKFHRSAALERTYDEVVVLSGDDYRRNRVVNGIGSVAEYKHRALHSFGRTQDNAGAHIMKG